MPIILGRKPGGAGGGGAPSGPAGGVLGGTYPNPDFDANAASSLDYTGGLYTATDVEGVLDEIAPLLGGMVLLEEIILGSDAASIDFQNISQNYHHLIVRSLLRSTAVVVTSETYARFNNDSGSNYNRQRISGVSTTAAAQAGAGEAQIGQMYVPGASASASRYGFSEIIIPFYNLTLQHKIVRAHVASMATDTGTDFYTSQFAAIWKDTSAVTRVTLLPSASDFLAGSRACLYGVT